VKLYLENIVCRVEDADRSELFWLDAYLTVEPKRPGGETLHVMNMALLTFPSGLLSRVIAAAVRDGFSQPEVVDRRAASVRLREDWEPTWLRDYQHAAVAAILKHERGLLEIPTGGGKCLGLGTPVLLFDGRTVSAEQVQTGDRLMGPDSQPRTVRSTTRGRGYMFRIVPNKGDPWTCNDVHMLTLVDTMTGRVEDVALDEWHRRSGTYRHTRKLFQPEHIDFPPREAPPVDPYFLGLWYGDGRRDLTQGVQVSKPDPEVEATCRATAQAWGLELRIDTYKSCPTHRLVRADGTRGKPNPLTEAMRALIGNAERLPEAYRTGSADTRRALLAGLLDADGHKHHGFYEVVQRRAGLAQDIAFLARSLGFRVTSRNKHVGGYGDYTRLAIIGDATALPMRIARKLPEPRRQRKDARRVGFTVEALGEGEYAGFELDGDGRFLLGDYTVTHNTEIIAATVTKIAGRALVLVHRKGLVRDIAARLLLRTGEVAGIIGDGDSDTDQRVTVATFQAVRAAMRSNNREVIALLERVVQLHVDECFPAGTRVSTPTGDVPIESVKSGDLVDSFDPSEQRHCQRRVLQTFKTQATRLVRVHFRDGSHVVCTPGHQFYTSEGWTCAAHLASWHHVRSIHVLQGETDGQDGGEELHNLHDSSGVQREEGSGAGALSECVLLGNVPPRRAGDDEQPRQPDLEGGSRSGRAESLRGAQSQGCQEGRAVGWRRVDRVEVLQSEGDGAFSGVSTDGYVYNFEVEDTHVYVAGGVVVHNCHTVPAGQMQAVVNRARAARVRIGYSGTPMARGDSKNLLTVGALGPVIYKLATTKLVEEGVLAQSVIRFLPCVQTWAHPRSDWHATYKTLIVESVERNALLVAMVDAAAKPALLFVHELEHGRALATAINGSTRWKAGFVAGVNDTTERDEAIRQLEVGELDVIVATVVFNEGIDIPTLASGIAGAGGMSVIAALQRLGRAMRVAAGKTTFEWWDVADRGNPILERHARKRIGAYRAAGHDPHVQDGSAKQALLALTKT
jgi:superfamily II DNA or RNA helicase